MAIYENLSEYKGKPVADWSDDASINVSPNKVYRVRIDYDDEAGFAEKLSSLLDAEGADQIESLVIGAWQGDDTQADSAEIVQALVSARDKLTRLRNLFIGDIQMEECEISWIQQTDLSPLLGAYPKLESLTTRGGEGLSFGKIQHDSLKELIVQTGGLPPSVIHEIGSAKLPALEHLELWLGSANYGGDATVEDLAPLLKAGAFPKLKYLGLKNSEIQDDIAGVIAMAPVLGQLEVLDLSMGTLSDAGAKSLLNSPGIRKLKKLDLRHHYISDEVSRQLGTLGIDVDLNETQDDDGPDDRYISVSE